MTAARPSVRSKRLSSTGGKKKPAPATTVVDSSSDSDSESDTDVPVATFSDSDTKLPLAHARRLGADERRGLAKRAIESARTANNHEPWSKRLEQRQNAFTPFPHLRFNDTAEDYSFGLSFSFGGAWSSLVDTYKSTDSDDSSDGCLRLQIPFNNEADMGLQKGVLVPRRIALTSVSISNSAPFSMFARLRAKTATGKKQTWLDGINRLAGNAGTPHHVGLLVGPGFSDKERCLFEWDQQHICGEAFQHWATLDVDRMIYDIKASSDDSGLAAFSHVPTAHVLGLPLHYLAARHCGDLYADAKDLAMLARVKSIVPRSSGSEFRVPLQALRTHVSRLAEQVDRDAHIMNPSSCFLELLLPDYDAQVAERAKAQSGVAKYISEPYVQCAFQFHIDGQVATHTELSSVIDELLDGAGEADAADGDDGVDGE